MTDYSKSKIYKIQHNIESSLFYIGSTVRTLEQRLSVHKCRSKTENYPCYYVINNTGGWENYNITLIKDFPCNDKEELLKEEQIYINTLKPTLNTHNAYTNQIEYDKNYREKNKEKISAPVTCECGAIITKSNKARHMKSKKHFKLLNK